MENLIQYWWVLVALIIFFGSFFTINQGYIGVVTMFGKYQRVVLPGLRKEIGEYVKEQVDHVLENWGYHLLDLQINDITFDKVILDSMSKVVASNNLKAAAENEGQALLITKTKAAEAEGNAIKISAEAEKEAARLRDKELHFSARK